MERCYRLAKPGRQEPRQRKVGREASLHCRAGIDSTLEKVPKERTT